MQQPSKNKKIAMVILAAGASTRMKTIKQMLPWKNTTLLGNTIAQGLASEVDMLFVVLGANKEKILPTLTGYNIQIIENREWEFGLGKSIACAVEFLQNSPTRFDGILIALADQPLMTAFYYNKLVSKFSKSDFAIVATRQYSIIGVPAIFGQKYFDQLAKLNEDTGAKSVLKKNMDNVYFIDADGMALDVDTMNSYTQLHEQYGL